MLGEVAEFLVKNPIKVENDPWQLKAHFGSQISEWQKYVLRWQGVKEFPTPELRAKSWAENASAQIESHIQNIRAMKSVQLADAVKRSEVCYHTYSAILDFLKSSITDEQTTKEAPLYDHIPNELVPFVWRFVRGVKAPRKVGNRENRDLAIRFLLYILVNDYGLQQTRDKISPSGDSAADVVAEAFGMTFETVANLLPKNANPKL